MRIEQLEYLAAVTRHGSLRRASEELHLSQPALSEAVAKLERELGVTLLDRRRSGARISRRGRELQEYMTDVLGAVERLRRAAGDQRAHHPVVRVGTVSTATSTLLVPTVREFRTMHLNSTVEVLNLRQAEIDEGLREGTLDLGLVNVLAGDDPPADLVGSTLARGRPVVVLPADHPLAARTEITADDLRSEPFVAMRAGYLMHRFAHRLFGADPPPASCTTDGAELGKLMVAEGVGLTVLPDYSVAGDPLERAGLICRRPLAHDATAVSLVLLRRPQQHVPRTVRDFASTLVSRASTALRDGTGGTGGTDGTGRGA